MSNGDVGSVESLRVHELGMIVLDLGTHMIVSFIEPTWIMISIPNPILVLYT